MFDKSLYHLCPADSTSINYVNTEAKACLQSKICFDVMSLQMFEWKSSIQTTLFYHMQTKKFVKLFIIFKVLQGEIKIGKDEIPAILQCYSTRSHHHTYQQHQNRTLQCLSCYLMERHEWYRGKAHIHPKMSKMHGSIILMLILSLWWHSTKFVLKDPW